MGKERIEFKSNEDIEQLKSENASLAFDLMIADGKAEEAKQEIADLNFQLMISGVL